MSPRAPHRFYYAGHLTIMGDDPVELPADESHHLLNVLRLKPGSPIELFDAGGRAWRAELAGRHADRATVRLLESIQSEPIAGPQVHLAVAVIKRRPMDWMIEKLSELGVLSLQPLLCSRCVGLGDIRPHCEPPERWERLAVAAAKQCGRNIPLEILPPAPVVQWLERARPPAQTAFAHTGPDARRIGEWLAVRGVVSLPFSVAIGPEGGWTPDEASAFEAAGFHPAHLGRLTLRTETAALAAAAACRLA